MKFIQIAITRNDDGIETVFAIDANGNLYERKYRTLRRDLVFWWEPVDYPIGEPKG